MNTPIDLNSPVHHEPAGETTVVRVEEYVTKHPGLIIFAVLGIGAAATLVVRAMTPPPSPRSRMIGLLEDIQDRLSEMSKPIYAHTNKLIENSAHALGKGVGNIEDLGLDNKLNKLSRWLKNVKR